MHNNVERLSHETWPVDARRSDLDLASFLQSAAAQIVIWLAILACLVVVGVYLIGKARQLLRADRPSASDLLTNFRELHGKGVLDDKEFRTIKSVLAERVQQEIKGNGEEG